MTRYSRFLATAGLTVIALASSTEIMRGQLLESITVPPVPSTIPVPEGHTAYLKGHAVGTQNYMCLPSATSTTGFAWTLVGPQATLFITFRWFQGEIRQQIATHFSSPNPSENGLPRPTWQSSLDTSAVWGKMSKSSDDANYVAPGAIPWLLVQIVGAQSGPAGGDMLTPAKYIHRVNTSGGAAPPTGCSQSANIGATVFAPYAADYFFYRLSQKN